MREAVIQLSDSREKRLYMYVIHEISGYIGNSRKKWLYRYVILEIRGYTGK